MVASTLGQTCKKSLERFTLRRKCFKDLTEVSKIIRRANETLPDFKERWTEKMSYIQDVLGVMQISAFMSNSKCLELASRFSDQVPKIVTEMMRRMDDLVKSEEAYKSTKLPKGEHPEKGQGTSYRGNRPPRAAYRGGQHMADNYHNSNRRDHYQPYVSPRAHHRRYDNQRHEVNHLSLNALTKRPKEILATKLQLQIPPCPPMIETSKKENLDRYCDYHDKEEARQQENNSGKGKIINVVWVRDDSRKRKHRRNQEEDWMNTPITFPPISADDVSDEPLIIKAETELVGFPGEQLIPMGKIELKLMFGSEGLCRRTMMKFMVRLEEKHIIPNKKADKEESGGKKKLAQEDILVNPAFPKQRVTIGTQFYPATWMAFKGNTRDLGAFGGITKRRRQDFHSDGITDLATASEHENPIRTLGDYSKPSHKGYRNTIELPKGNNEVPLRSDTIRNAEESWTLLEDLALYDNESWNDPRDFAKPVKAISLPQGVPSTSDCRLIELKNEVQCLMEAHLPPKQPVQVTKISSSCEICSCPYDTQCCMENPEQAFVDYASSYINEAGEPEKTLENEFKDFHLNLPDLKVLAHALMYNAILKKYVESLELGKNRLADETKSYPVGIVRDVEVHIVRLKPLNNFCVIDMKKDPETPLPVGRGFLETVNAVIDCRKAKIAVGEGITRLVFRVKGIKLGEEEIPYWIILGKRESYRPRPSSDGVGARTPYYAKKEFIDYHLPDE
ncbi:hypothetical protein Tco_0717075 [Tanacetum coccineum]